MAEQYDYDVVILGSGPGGYVAAIRASQLGLSAAVIEKDAPGGVCLNIGCIPSKSLIHQAEVFRSATELEAMGVRVDRSGLDYAKVFATSRTASETLSKGVRFLLKKNKVELIEGAGTIAGPHEIRVGDDRVVTGKFLLIATGSRPRELPGFAFDERSVLSSTGALMLQKLPKSLLILGSGYIGMEFAHVMNAFGVEVHVVEMLSQVLPNEDVEIVRVVQRCLRKRGVKFTVSTRATEMHATDASVTVTLEPAKGPTQTVEAEKLLVAVGRVPNTEGIGLEAGGVETENGFVTVGDYYRTSCPSVYAIGDITPSPMLAHVASAEGEIAIEHIAGHTPDAAKVDPLTIPGVIYCEPQVASFGYNEAAAKTAGVAYAKAAFPYRGVGKSVAIGAPDGLVKILYAPETHEILGAQIVGADATELIHQLLLATTAGLLPADIAGMIHAHPTLSEAVMEAARKVEGWAVHA